MSNEALATILAVQDTLDAGQEITAEKSCTRVVLYRQSIILVHRFYTIVLCADCGGGKASFVTGGDDALTPQQADHFAQRLRASTPKCLCKPPVQKQEG
jgi:hypothetical protein